MSWVSPSPLVSKVKPKNVTIERSVCCDLVPRSAGQPVVLKHVPLQPKTASPSLASRRRKGLILGRFFGRAALTGSKCQFIFATKNFPHTHSWDSIGVELLSS